MSSGSSIARRLDAGRSSTLRSPISSPTRSDPRREPSRAGDGRRAAFAFRDQDGNVAPACFGERAPGARQSLDLVWGKTRREASFENRDRRRYRAAGTHVLLKRARRLQVLRPRHAVRDDRRLERDDRPSRGKRRRNFGVHAQRQRHRSLVGVSQIDPAPPSRSSSAIALSTTPSTLKPYSRMTTAPGAEAPKRSTPTTSPRPPT